MTTSPISPRACHIRPGGAPSPSGRRVFRGLGSPTRGQSGGLGALTLERRVLDRPHEEESRNAFVRRQTESELRAIRDNLEQLVADRTTALQAINAQLPELRKQGVDAVVAVEDFPFYKSVGYGGLRRRAPRIPLQREVLTSFNLS